MVDQVGDKGTGGMQQMPQTTDASKIIQDLIAQFKSTKKVDQKKLNDVGITKDQFLSMVDDPKALKKMRGQFASTATNSPQLTSPTETAPKYSVGSWLDNAAQLKVFFMLTFDLADIQMEQIIAEALHEADIILAKSELSSEKASLILEKYELAAEQLMTQAITHMAAGATNLAFATLSASITFSNAGKIMANRQKQRLENNPDYNPDKMKMAQQKYVQAKNDWNTVKQNHDPGTKEYKAGLNKFQTEQRQFIKAQGQYGPGKEQLDHYQEFLLKQDDITTFAAKKGGIGDHRGTGVSVQKADADLKPEHREALGELRNEVNSNYNNFDKHRKSTEYTHALSELSRAFGKFVESGIESVGKMHESYLKMQEGEVEAMLELLRDTVELYRKESESTRESKQKAAQLLSHYLEGAASYMRSKNQAIGMRM